MGVAASEVGRWLIVTIIAGIALWVDLSKIQVIYSGIKFFICPQIFMYGSFWIITFLPTSIFGGMGVMPPPK